MHINGCLRKETWQQQWTYLEINVCLDDHRLSLCECMRLNRVRLCVHLRCVSVRLFICVCVLFFIYRITRISDDFQAFNDFACWRNSTYVERPPFYKKEQRGCDNRAVHTVVLLRLASITYLPLVRISYCGYVEQTFFCVVLLCMATHRTNAIHLLPRSRTNARFVS